MIKKLAPILIVLFAIVVLCGCFNAHEHNFEQNWSYNEENHFYKSTCGHDVVDNIAPHCFDEGVVNQEETQIVYTCQTCQYQTYEAIIPHVCSFEGLWVVSTPATIFSVGEQYRECSDINCTLRETQVIDKIEVVSIEVTTQPTKLSYNTGDAFDSSGIFVNAIGADDSITNVTQFVTFDKTILAEEDTFVVVSYLQFTAQIQIEVVTPTPVLTVTQARQSEDFENLYVLKGYFVGLSDEGYNLTKEILLKDYQTDDVISVRSLPDSYGTWPNVGYAYGDEVQLYGKLVKLTYDESDTKTQNKVYFEFDLDKNPDQIEQTIISQKNSISYKLDQVVELQDWKEWKSLFNPSTIQAYTYINIKGTVYLNTYLAFST